MVKFKLGQVLSTCGVHDRMKEDPDFKRFVYTSLLKYVKGDWGDSYPEDAEMNDAAVASGEDRILAVYIPPRRLCSNLRFDQSGPPKGGLGFPKEIQPPGEADKIWIITEADHSSTTVLFPRRLCSNLRFDQSGPPKGGLGFPKEIQPHEY